MMLVIPNWGDRYAASLAKSILLQKGSLAKFIYLKRFRISSIFYDAASLMRSEHMSPEAQDQTNLPDLLQSYEDKIREMTASFGTNIASNLCVLNAEEQNGSLVIDAAYFDVKSNHPTQLENEVKEYKAETTGLLCPHFFDQLYNDIHDKKRYIDQRRINWLADNFAGMVKKYMIEQHNLVAAASEDSLAIPEDIISQSEEKREELESRLQSLRDTYAFNCVPLARERMDIMFERQPILRQLIFSSN